MTDKAGEGSRPTRGDGGVVTTSTATSGLNINLHPLPILNISEHSNRARLSSPQGSKLIGALLGSQNNRDVSIVNTFELVYGSNDGGAGEPSGSGAEQGEAQGEDVNMDPSSAESASAVAAAATGQFLVDVEFFEGRRQQFKDVFPTQEIVGWYSVGDAPDQEDVSLHQQLATLIDSPIFLLFHPNPPPNTQDLPISVYEAALSDSQGAGEGEGSTSGGGKFVKLEYGVETGEAERIAVDGVSRGGAGDDDEYSVVGNLTTQRNAIKMLCDRIQIITDYIGAIMEKTAKPDHAIIRQISSLVATLPTIDAKEFQDEMVTEYQDVQITTYLTELTKQLDALSDYSDKTHMAHPPARDDDLGPMMQKGFGGGGRAGRRRHQG